MTTTKLMRRADAEDFVYAEAALLDGARFGEWLELFAEDGVYWVPANEADNDPERHVSIIYDTRDGLADRIARYQLGRVVQEVPSRTLHLVGNVRVVEDAEPDVVEVTAAMVLYEVHGSRTTVHPAQCRYLLTPGPEGWRIVLKKVAFLDNDQYFPNLAYLF
jgi:3-phenylpropionate/cinnamic acid dioxygenase small subunit